MADHVTAAYAEVAPESRPALISYRSSVGETCRRTGTSIEDLLLAELDRVRRQEIERGVCLVGPHRDDLDLTLGELPAKGYASHGESWSFALALRLGGYELMRVDGIEPVLVLDDVFAELDRGRRQQLAKVAAAAEQVLITAAVAEDVPDELTGARFEVHGGEVAACLTHDRTSDVARSGVSAHTSGDKSVDGVDNSVTNPDLSTGSFTPEGESLKGSDLARAALEAAKASREGPRTQLPGSKSKGRPADPSPASLVGCRDRTTATRSRSAGSPPGSRPTAAGSSSSRVARCSVDGPNWSARTSPSTRSRSRSATGN